MNPVGYYISPQIISYKYLVLSNATDVVSTLFLIKVNFAETNKFHKIAQVFFSIMIRFVAFRHCQQILNISRQSSVSGGQIKTVARAHWTIILLKTSSMAADDIKTCVFEELLMLKKHPRAQKSQCKEYQLTNGVAEARIRVNQYSIMYGMWVTYICIDATFRYSLYFA